MNIKMRAKVRTMNKRLILLVSIGLLGVVVGVAGAEVPPGAFAIYCFADGSAGDLSGNGRNGILSGGASISGGLLRLGGSAHLEIPGVGNTIAAGTPWTIYLKGFACTGDSWVSMVAVGSDGRGGSVVLHKNLGNFGTDVWYDYMLPVISSVDFLDGTAREMFITYDGIWKLYDGASEMGIGGHSYSKSGGSVYIGAPPWGDLLSDLPYQSPRGTVEAIAVYDRLLDRGEMAELMEDICVSGPRIEFESADSAEVESDGSAVIGVVMENAGQSGTYTVDYAATGGTAVNGEDYVLTAGTLTFAPGETSGSIDIQIIEDGLAEEHETIELTLSNAAGPDGADLGEVAGHTHTILDARPRVQFGSESGSVAERVQIIHRPVGIGVELSAASASSVTVEYGVTGGTATLGVDYLLGGSGTLTFAPGQVRSEIPVTIVEDNILEDDKTIELTLSGPSAGSLLGDNDLHTLTIIDGGQLEASDVDFNNDGSVNFGDLAVLAESWLDRTLMPAAAPVSEGLVIEAVAAQGGSASEPVKYIGDDWGHTSHHDGRLRPVVGVGNYEVMQCNRTYPELSDGYGWTYNHGPNIAYWNGKVYVHYLSNPVSEHEEAGHTLLCHSVEGRDWSFPVVIFPEYQLSGEDYILMHQRMGFYVAENGRLLVLGFYGIPTGGNNSPNKGNGIGRVVREVYPDDTFGPIHFIRYNRHNGFNEGNTIYPLYSASGDQGFKDACAELLSKKLITQQWWEEDQSDDGFYAMDDSADGFSCKAFSFYHRDDNTVVGLWKKGFAALSVNEGQSWTTPVYCPTLADSTSKHWGQRTDDGRYALLYNPPNRRFPLVVVTGDDGRDFDNKLTVHGELPVRRFDGEFKQAGPQYIRGIIEGNGDPPGEDMWVTYSMNKEDIWVSRVPLPVRYGVEEQVDDNFEDMTAGGVVADWNIYHPTTAPVEVVESDGKYLQFKDTSRYDYAKAVRVFPETDNAAAISFRVRAHQSDTEEFDVDVVEQQGRRPVRIVFDKSGKIIANNDIHSVEVGSYQENVWLEVTIQVDVTKQQYDLWIDNEKVLTAGMFAESATSIERIEFRTGEYRLSEVRGLTPEWPDFPNADEPVALAVFDIDDVATTNPYDFGQADVNKDGVVNLLDLAALLQNLLL